MGAPDSPPLRDLARLGAAGRLAIACLTPLPARLPTARAVRVSSPARLASVALRALLHGALVEPGVAYIAGGAVRLTVESVDGATVATTTTTTPANTPSRVGRGTALLQAGDPDPPPPCPPSPGGRPRSATAGHGGRGRHRRRGPG